MKQRKRKVYNRKSNKNEESEEKGEKKRKIIERIKERRKLVKGNRVREKRQIKIHEKGDENDAIKRCKEREMEVKREKEK